jgi:hypothetical protein
MGLNVPVMPSGQAVSNRVSQRRKNARHASRGSAPKVLRHALKVHPADLLDTIR